MSQATSMKRWAHYVAYMFNSKKDSTCLSLSSPPLFHLQLSFRINSRPSHSPLFLHLAPPSSSHPHHPPLLPPSSPGFPSAAPSPPPFSLHLPYLFIFPCRRSMDPPPHRTLLSFSPLPPLPSLSILSLPLSLASQFSHFTLFSTFPTALYPRTQLFRLLTHLFCFFSPYSHRLKFPSFSPSMFFNTSSPSSL